MANRNSDNIANIVSSPVSILVGKVKQKAVLIDQAALLTTNIDNADDNIFFGPIPSNAIVTSIKIFNDDLDSNATPTLACDVGLVYTGIGGSQPGNGKVLGDVIDADLFGSAITTLQAANVSGVELRGESAANGGDIVAFKKELWDAGGLSSDPGGMFAIQLDITTAAATAAAGDVVLMVEYLI